MRAREIGEASGGMKPATEIDLQRLRERMVEYQMRRRGVGDERVLAVIAELPRHEFVPPEFLDEAYEDHPVPIGESQTISQPYMVAVMTETLELQGHERLLEIGTGSGYQAAVLARLAQAVYTIEKNAHLARTAEERLARLGFANVVCLVGDGTLGYPEAAPYDGILVTAGAPSIPPPLKEQLAEGGRLVIPVGEMHSQELLQLRRMGGQFVERSVNYCRFVPLIGRYGWGGVREF